MAEEIEAGKSLAQAYEEQKEHLPPLYRALIQAGIASGDLPAVLEEIARHAGERAQVATRLRKALLYPVVSAIGVIGIGVVMFAFFGPSVEGLLDRNVAPWVRPNTATVWWSYAPWMVLGVFALVIAGVLLFAWFRHPLDGSVGPRGFGFRFPCVGRLRTFAAKAGFASTMAMLIKRQMPLPESLRLAAAATDQEEVAAQIRAMQDCAESGESLTESVRAGDLISPAMLWFVAAGEAGGTPATSLADVAGVYRQRLDRGVDRLCFLVTPILLLMTGFVVLGFAVAYLAPIFHYYKMVLWGG